MTIRICLILFCFCFSDFSFSGEKPLIRLGVLAFGTTNWELAAIEQQKPLTTADFILEIHKLANPQAGKIALQADAVDMIVTDWIWVARMRSKGSDYSFYPYSSASGALMVAANSGINSLDDLCEKRLGIAGDELDKNWLLLQAFSAKSKCPFTPDSQKSFGAAPLLNQQLIDGHVDAVLNYWHYAAQLEGEGFKQLLNGQQLLHGLGITTNMPNLGYVFKRSWAIQNSAALKHFFTLTENVRDQMCISDSVWKPIIPLLKTDNSKTQGILRQRYCEGRVYEWGDTQMQNAAKLYSLLRSVSGDKLTGTSKTVPDNTFWINP